MILFAFFTSLAVLALGGTGGYIVGRRAGRAAARTPALDLSPLALYRRRREGIDPDIREERQSIDASMCRIRALEHEREYLDEKIAELEEQSGTTA